MSANTRLPCHGKHDLPAWSILQKECKYPGCQYYLPPSKPAAAATVSVDLPASSPSLPRSPRPGNKPIVTAKKAKLSVGGGCGGNSSDGGGGCGASAPAQIINRVSSIPQSFPDGQSKQTP